ncbi:MAG: hypothetical protein QOI12_3124 [Alphaproteobacteria bacterium]|jgi:hypothetical protein|nr:hypothetical protein [Alphaproteobacteria bacterium]
MAKMASALVVVSMLLLGLLAEGATAKQPAKLMLMRSVSANNGTGVLASGNRAAILMRQMAVSGNGTGWKAENAGMVSSYGDNSIDANTDNGGNPPVIPTR